MYKIYISYVIQSSTDHKHDSTIVEFSKDPVAIYSDNSASEVVKWAQTKQAGLKQDEKIIILSFFNFSNN